MALSTSLGSPPDAGEAVAALRRFYRWQARLYDWTRPLILFGREELLTRTRLPPRAHVVDVGCGTGFSFASLVPRAERVTGVETSPEMRARAQAAARRLGAAERVSLDERAWGTHEDRRATADLVLFSYSLSMMPAYPAAVRHAASELRPGGELAVVDFLDAAIAPVRVWLTGCHVQLGHDRLDALRRSFPDHNVSVRQGAFWSYFLFWGRERV